MEGTWAKKKSAVLQELETDEIHGLAKAEAIRRLRRFGPNEIEVKDGPSSFWLFLRQFQSSLIYILIVAAVITIIRKEWTEAAVIGGVIVVNAVIGWVQEYRARQTMAALRRILSPRAKVIRQSIEEKIAARGLVVGDIVKLEAGDRVPADIRLLSVQSLKINEAALTGESVPSAKSERILPLETPLADRDNMAYLSTLVVAGQAIGVVVATGMNTEFGAIAKEVARIKPVLNPLERQMRRFGQVLSAAALMLSALVLVVGLIRQFDLLEMIKTTVSLLVAIVPEGLPIAVTVMLSVGLLRVYRKRAVIRQLAAAETLGSTTVICVDKTGTLTEGEMMAEKMIVGGKEYEVTGKGFGLSGQFFENGKKINVNQQASAKLLLELTSLVTATTITKDDLKNDEARQLTDPTETALAVLAAKAGYFSFALEKKNPEVLEVPFDQQRRFSVSVRRRGNINRYIVKGAPEQILALSKKVIGASGTARSLLSGTRDEIEAKLHRHAESGYRLIALGYVDYPARQSVALDKVKNLTFVGAICLADPIRPEVSLAIKKAKSAGIRVIMVTGDHLLTARSIAAKIGLLDGGLAIHAADLRKANLAEVTVIARSTPEDKLKLIAKLQKMGEVVAMTGDGVNDAPALKRADIGIAMGRSGTDVAVETSGMVLLSDNFASIVDAVEQGRLIWENLRKVVFYLVATTFANAVVILASLAAGLPLPLLAVQFIWMNLVTDGITSMALTVEPEEHDLMKRPPRSPKTPVVDFSTVRRMALLSLVMTAGSLLVFVTYLPQGEAYARTATLTTMVFFQLFNIFNARSATVSVFRLPLVSNRLLLVLFATAASIHLLSVYHPSLQKLLHTVSLDWSALVFSVTVALSVVLADELRKIARRLTLAWAKTQESFS